MVGPPVERTRFPKQTVPRARKDEISPSCGTTHTELVAPALDVKVKDLFDETRV